MKSLRELLQFVPSGRESHLLRRFNSEIGRKDTKPPSARTLAECLGFTVSEKELENGVSGYLEPDTFSEKGYAILVNSSMNVRRKRWTVLHEIAHYYLHVRTKPHDPFAPIKNRESKGYFYSREELKEEREANAFVAALCFSDGALTAAISDSNNDLQEIANSMGLSLEAIKIAIQRCRRD
ncbi:MAG: ImmA/IrrE family metallo-endopeptidase [Paracoccaceae bacterium]